MSLFIKTLFVLSIFEVSLAGTAKSCRSFLDDKVFTVLQAHQEQRKSLTDQVLELKNEEIIKHLKKEEWPEIGYIAHQLKMVSLYENIQNYIRNELLYGEIQGLPRYLTLGSTEVYSLQFKSGLKAIFKPKPEHWVITSKFPQKHLSNTKAEVAAYRFAQLLGLPHVPTTVLREVDGKWGSVQVFVQSQSTIEISVLNKDKGQLQSAIDIYAFDFLIQNADRNELNMLIDGNRFWAIDSGSSFHPHEIINGVNTLIIPQMLSKPSGNVSSSFFENLNLRATPKKLYEELSGLVEPHIISELIDRRALFLEYFRNE